MVEGVLGRDLSSIRKTALMAKPSEKDIRTHPKELEEDSLRGKFARVMVERYANFLWEPDI